MSSFVDKIVKFYQFFSVVLLFTFMHRRRILCTLRLSLDFYSNKFCNGGVRPKYAPAPPPPSVWALKPPSWALVHKNTYAPMIYTALCIMFLMHAYPFLGQVGGGWPLNSRVFWAPNGTRLSAQCHFTGPKKLPNSRAQHPTPCPCNGYAHIQNIIHGCINDAATYRC